MKNLHILPTDNYSQLVNSTSKYGGLFLSKYYSPMKDMGDSYQNIYITSDENPKEGDWFLGANNIVYSFTSDDVKNGFKPKGKKIILTTDQDLIKDGVQAIDDEFLEWFVKNPSCDYVEIDKLPDLQSYNEITYKCNSVYQIIIPLEFSLNKNIFNKICSLDETQEEAKQETLEEAAKLTALNQYDQRHQDFEDGFILGANYQVERMYSEKDLKQFAFECVANFLSNSDNKVEMKLVDVIIDRLDAQFEQFKKK
jgi:hypothetical protein